MKLDPLALDREIGVIFIGALHTDEFIKTYISVRCDFHRLPCAF